MACYTLNKEKMILTLDNNAAPTAAEQVAINAYVANGYEIRIKSEKRAKEAKKRAKADGLTDKAILEALANDKTNLKTYKEIKAKKGKGGGFFAAKAWYKENCM